MLFLKAIQDITQRPVLALRLLFLPLVLTTAAELFYTHRLINSAAFEDAAGLVISTLAGFASVGLIAVGWHRHMLCAAPVPVIPSHSIGLYWSYFKHWFILGLVIFLAMLLVLAVCGMLLWLVLDEDLLLEYFFDTAATASILPVVLVIVFCWALFRFGIVLPHVALGHDDMGFARAWELTQAQGTAICWTAVWAGAAQALLYGAAIYALTVSLDPVTGIRSTAAEYGLAVVSSVVYTGITLVGAAILTVIYSRIPPEALAAPQQSQP